LLAISLPLYHMFVFVYTCVHVKCLTLINPFTANCENAMCLSQCHALWEVPTLKSIEMWITFDLLNRFSISFLCFWEQWMLFASVCNISTPGQLKSHQVRQANHFSLPCQVA
jgi:hypothetical protein